MNETTTEQTVKERPILFTADMVNAILDGRKTQTRRVMKPQPCRGCEDESGPFYQQPIRSEIGLTFWERVRPRCPYGKPGDLLYVRESWAHDRQFDHLAPTPVGREVRLVAEAVELVPTTLVCDITAYHVHPDGDRLIGRGRHVQRILPKSLLKTIVERAT